MIVYGLKTCDSCRKARAALKAAGHPAELRDLRETPLAPAEIAHFLAAFGNTLVNHRSTTWRALPEAERAKDPTALLAAHPALMKRPVIEVDGRLYLGWGREVQEELLGKAAPGA
ncbi:arsenate reductase [Rhodovulum tesquicola]|uniref:arsenate reductase family protein n=1 Tax=Rhodovulum tesquicola TaxID=540254 RepID=UPI0020970585|nr:ArsC/Spx/MgsR family protein [Rhodovulum tesquicola]MCO8146158.1 arsenate reductase [Rhodovulum tesquicola]